MCQWKKKFRKTKVAIIFKYLITFFDSDGDRERKWFCQATGIHLS